MHLWIFITIAAAFFQNIRSALQKHLKGVMGTTGATFVRFGFGIPFAAIYWLIFYQFSDGELPSFNMTFLFWVTVASISQIVATFLLVYLFSFRNFAVGTAYSRTEAAQTALFAFLFFGERVGAGGLIAIAISVVGVMLISVARTAVTFASVFTSIFSRTAAIGLASGMLYGIASVGYRAAALSLEGLQFYMQAANTLCFAIVLQSILMIGWMMVREPDEIGRIIKAWKPALLVGFVGATATFGWFTAFTLQQAALVKVVAQVEMIFTFAASIFVFREKILRLEVLGCILITAGIVMLLLWSV